MFLIFAFILLGVVAIFLIANLVAPESELMNTFKTVKGFKVMMGSLVLISLLLIGANTIVVHNEQWRESAIIQVENESGELELFVGNKEEAALAYKENPSAGEPYQTELLLWGTYEHVTMKITYKEDETVGYQTEPMSIKETFNSEAYIKPIELTFEKEGIWRVEVLNNEETLGNIVLKVE